MTFRLRAEGVSKRFPRSLRSGVLYGFQDAGRRLMGLPPPGLREGEQWALHGVSFELAAGESLAIMGRNGAGKSTLLRIVAGIYRPDEGRVAIRGRTGALVAAGAGFSPLLTGRENVLVNGALLGLTRREIGERLDEIIAFSGLEDSIDLPVGQYSSGMAVRLGFAVATAMRPELLLVDELLSMGDLGFQKRCLDHLLGLKAQGTSIVLVSHSVASAWALCERAILIDGGRLLADGCAGDVIRTYQDTTARHEVAADALRREAAGGSGESSGDGAVIHAVRTLDGNGGAATDLFELGAPIVIEAELEVRRPIEEPVLRYTVDATHYRFIVVLDSHEQGLRPGRLAPGRYRWRTRLPRPNLRPGAYRLNANVTRRDYPSHLFVWNDACTFQVAAPREQILYTNPNAVVHFEAPMSLEPLAGPFPS